MRLRKTVHVRTPTSSRYFDGAARCSPIMRSVASAPSTDGDAQLVPERRDVSPTLYTHSASVWRSSASNKLSVNFAAPLKNASEGQEREKFNRFFRKPVPIPCRAVVNESSRKASAKRRKKKESAPVISQRSFRSCCSWKMSRPSSSINACQVDAFATGRIGTPSMKERKKEKKVERRKKYGEGRGELIKWETDKIHNLSQVLKGVENIA